MISPRTSHIVHDKTLFSLQSDRHQYINLLAKLRSNSVKSSIWTEICSQLILRQTTKLNSSILKTFADDKLNLDLKIVFAFERTKSIVGKCYLKHFSDFLTAFNNRLSQDRKMWIFHKIVKSQTAKLV